MNSHAQILQELLLLIMFGYGLAADPTMAPTSMPGQSCPTGWLMYSNKCYYIDTGNRNYATCNSLCTAANARMLCLENADEANFLANNPLLTRDALLSLNDLDNVDFYVWGDGCPSTYFPWATGSSTHAANCVVFRTGQEDFLEVDCTDSAYNCICETDLVLNSPACPVGWVVGPDGDCYFFESIPSTYSQCQSTCTSMNADTLCIKNDDQNSFIWSMRPTRSTWIGYVQEVSGFQWRDGCTSAYTNWGPSEPNNGDGPFRALMHLSLAGKWVDLLSNGPGAYCACQMPVAWQPLTGTAMTLTSEHAPSATDASVELSVTVTTTSSADRVLVLFNGNYGEALPSTAMGAISITRDDSTTMLVTLQGGSVTEARAAPMAFLDTPATVANLVYSVSMSGSGSLNPTHPVSATFRQLSAVTIPSYMTTSKQTWTPPTLSVTTGAWMDISQPVVILRKLLTDWVLLLYTGSFTPDAGSSGTATIRKGTGVGIDIAPGYLQVPQGGTTRQPLTMCFMYRPTETGAVQYRARMLMTSGTAVFTGRATHLLALSLPQEQVSSTGFSGVISTTSATFVSIPGLALSIRPRSPSDKVVLLLNVNIGSTADADAISTITITRDGVNLGSPENGLQRLRTFGRDTPANIYFMDEPQTTGEVVYEVLWKTNDANKPAHTGPSFHQLSAFLVGAEYFSPTAAPTVGPPTPFPSLAPSASPTSLPGSSCPAGYFVYTNKCYYLSSRYMTYPECAAVCRTKKASQLCIENADQNAFIADNYPAPYVSPYQGIHIGYSDFVQEGVFKWNGTCASTFEAWDANQGTNANEDCTALQRNHKWRDVSCAAEQHACGCETPLTVATSICPVGWVVSNTGGCVWLETTPSPWSTCYNTCAAKSATMLCIQDQTQQDFIFDLFHGRDTWIGYYKEGASWRWPEGCSSTYDHWALGLDLTTGPVKASIDETTGEWVNQPASAQHHCACETKPQWKPLDAAATMQSTEIALPSGGNYISTSLVNIATAAKGEKVLVTVNMNWRSTSAVETSSFLLMRNGAPFGSAGTAFRTAFAPPGSILPMGLSYLNAPSTNFGQFTYDLQSKGAGYLSSGGVLQLAAIRIPTYYSSMGATLTTTLNLGNQYADLGITVTVTTTSADDRVLLMLNTQVVHADTLVALTLTRGATDLGGGSKLCVMRSLSTTTYHSAGNIVFLDSPPTPGVVSYSALARSDGAAQVMNVRHLSAIVFRRDQAASSTTSSPMLISSTTWVGLLFAPSLTMASASDEVLVTVTIPCRAEADGALLYFNLYRNNIALGNGALGLQSYRAMREDDMQTVTITYVDTPNLPGSEVTYTMAARAESASAAMTLYPDSSVGQISAVLISASFGMPTSEPSSSPSSQPSRQPSSQPSVSPTAQPSAQPTQAPSTLCPPDMVRHEEMCYLLHNAPAVTIQKDCRDYCTGLDLDMFCPRSAAEDAFVYSIRSVNEYWLGLTKVPGTNTIVGVEGSGCTINPEYVNLNTDEGQGLSEAGFIATVGGKWADVPATSQHAYACYCQKRAFAAPTSQPSQQPSSQPSALPTASPTTEPTNALLSVCPVGWTVYDNKCYAFHDVRMDWAQCRNMCRNQGASMFCVKNRHENDFIFAHVADTDGQGGPWLGFNDIASEGVYVNDGGCASSYVNWSLYGNEPTDNGQHLENCVHMWGPSSGVDPAWMGTWNDDACSSALNSCGCELPHTPSLYTCPVGWVSGYDGTCYSTLRQQVTHNACEAYCATQGATLPCVRDDDTNSLLYTSELRRRRNVWIASPGTAACPSEFTLWNDLPEPGQYPAIVDDNGGWDTFSDAAPDTACICEKRVQGWRPVESSVDSESSLVEVNSVSFVPLGLTARASAVSAGDSVLLTATVNLYCAQPSGYVKVAIYRGEYQLATSLQRVQLNYAGERAVATVIFMDQPNVGEFAYSVRVRGTGFIASANYMQRQLAAIVYPWHYNVNFTTVHAPVTVSSAEWQGVGLESSVLTGRAGDQVLVSVNLNVATENNGWVAATIFRDGINLAVPHTGQGIFQLVKGSRAGKTMQPVTVTFLDKPGSPGRHHYSVRVKSEGLPFTVSEGDLTRQLSLVVLSADAVSSAQASTMEVLTPDWLGLTGAAPIRTLSTADRVLVTANVNFNGQSPTTVGAFSVFRDGINLGAPTRGLSMVRTVENGTGRAATLTFVDSPGEGGKTFAYTLQGRQVEGSTIASYGYQVRTLTAVLVSELFEQPSSQPSSQPSARPSAYHDSGCAPGWTVYTDKCYLLSNQPLTYVGCSAYCFQQKVSGVRGSLPCVEGAGENRFLAANVPGDGNFWINLVKTPLSSSFSWNDAKCTSSYRHWSPQAAVMENAHQGHDQSHILGGGPDPTQCTQVTANGYAYWSVAACTETNMCVCEMPHTLSTTVCPVGWTVGKDGECYHFGGVSSTYEQCYDTCQGLGSTMLCINDAEEQDLVWALRGGRNLWLGFNKLSGDTFQWPEGCDSSYENWGPGEPQNNAIDRYAVMWTDFGGMWADLAEVALEDNVECVCERRVTWKPLRGSSIIATDETQRFVAEDEDIGLSVTASLVAPTESVLLLASLSIECVDASDPALLMVVRDGVTPLGGGTLSAVNPALEGLAIDGSFAFLDTPAAVGDAEYTVMQFGSGLFRARSLLAITIPSYCVRASASTGDYLAVPPGVWTDADLEVTVQPRSATDRVLLLASVPLHLMTVDGRASLTLRRGSTRIGDDLFGLHYIANSGDYDKSHMLSFAYLDDPSTTTATTYRVAARSDSSGNVVDISNNGELRSLVALVVPGQQVAAKTVYDFVVVGPDPAWTAFGLNVGIVPRSFEDAVLVIASFTVWLSSRAEYAAFTIFRDGVNLGHVTTGLKLVRYEGHTTVMLSFLDRPGIHGKSVTYSVRIYAPTLEVTLNDVTAHSTVTAVLVSDEFGAPSSVPTAGPSEPPTVRPSGAPTGQPSNTPSGGPTTVPSSGPSAQPSTQPSGQPVCFPTSRPTSQPTIQATLSPTSQPSSSPTRQPSSAPTAQPTSAPSVQPSGGPTSQPTGRPSAQPSSAPTAPPTAQPTGSPSSSPSTQPTDAPSTPPSAAPTSQPTSLPSGAPTTQPSANPTSEPSSQPTTQPSTTPSDQPSSQPSSAPTGVPSASPTTQPTVSPSAQPSARPTRRPQGLHSPLPTIRPTTQPSRQPTSQPTGQPTHSPSLAPRELVPAPLIAQLGAAANRTRIEVHVSLVGSVDAYVYCAAFKVASAQAAYPLQSVNEVLRQSSVAFSAQGLAVVRLTGLTPATSYHVFCVTESVDALHSPLTNAVEKSTTVTTLCCRRVTIALTTGNVQEGGVVANAVAVTLDSPPDDALAVTVSFLKAPPAAGTLLTAYPAHVLYSAAVSASATTYLTVAGGSAGAYTIQAALSGASAGQYQVVYAGRTQLTVLSVATEPSVPAVTTALFSDDGSQVVLSFDGPTNKGGFSSTFTCTKLLSFPGAPAASCLWKDAATIAVFPYYSRTAASQILVVDSPITVLPGKVRAQCTQANATRCAQFAAVPPSSVYVSTATTPTAPVVSIAAPSSIGGCNSLTVDLSGSTGSAGRPWSTVHFGVTTTPSNSLAAAALSTFLERNHTISPPTVIPNALLQSGLTYTIQATLCNFLGACGVAAKSVYVSASRSLIPTASILGKRSLTVRRMDALVLNSNSFTQSCQGVVSYANLLTEWNVERLDTTGTVTRLSALKSVSQNPAVFRLNGHSLSVGALYRITLNVTSLISQERATAAVQVLVQQSAVAAVISGGSPRVIKQGDTFTVDASRSIDEDVATLTGAAAGLLFEWSCVQHLPTFNASCPLELPADRTAASDKITVRSPMLSSNTQARITVRVYSGTRSSTAVVDVGITQTAMSELSITSSLSSVSNINTNQRLVLLGTVKLVSPCTAVWSVDDTSIALATAAVTPTTVALRADSKPQPFNLVVGAGRLPQRATLTFSLTCGTASTSLLVTTNGAPLPGEFLITPHSGTELITVFSFTALQWTDSDLPITYQFGFESVSSLAKLVIVSKSEFSYATSTLPAGQVSHDMALNCSLQVFDSLGAGTDVSNIVVVTPAVSIEERQTSVLALIDSNTGSVDDTKRVLSVASTVINSVNCTAAPNCTILHRGGCLTTDHSCGPCLDGYLGDAGDQNSPCIPYAASTAMRNRTVTVQCESDSGCPSWEFCSIPTGTCELQSKSCFANCSGHGMCIFASTSLGATFAVQGCKIDDQTCVAACSCDAHYSGRYCELSDTDLQRRRAVRSKLVQSLHNLTAVDDISKEAMESWSASLYTLSLNPFELSVTDAATVTAIANLTLRHAIELGVDAADQMKGVLQATDTVSAVREYNYNPNDADSSEFTVAGEYVNNTAAGIIPVLSLYTGLVKSSMVLGQPPVAYHYENFRLATHLHAIASSADNLTVSSPQTTFEQLVGTHVSSVTLVPSEAGTASSPEMNVVTVNVITVYPRAYARDTSRFESDPIYLQVSSQVTDAPSDYLSGLEVTFQRNSLNGNSYDEEPVNVTSRCHGNSSSEVYVRTCPGSLEAVVHNCTGRRGVYQTSCPVLTPTCAQLSVVSADFAVIASCTARAFNTTTLTCSCPLAPSTSRRRGLTGLKGREADIVAAAMDESGMANMVATSIYVATSFGNTFNSADELTTASDLAKVLTVIYLVAAVWGAGFLLLGGCVLNSNPAFREAVMKKVSKGISPSVEAPEKRSDAVALVDAKQRFLEYIESVVPKVYSSNKSQFSRLLAELCAHHRYMTLFTLGDGQTSLLNKVTIVLKVVTVDTMQMFLLAMLYDLESPEDDGSCVNYTTLSSCLSRKSPIDTSQEYCQWSYNNSTGNYACSYHEPATSAKAFIFILVFISIVTSIINIPIDSLFATCVAPLMSDAEAAQASSSLLHSRLSAAARNVVSNARRLSTAASSAAQTVRRRSAAVIQHHVLPVRNSIIGYFLPARESRERVIANREISEDLRQSHTQAVAMLSRVALHAELRQRQQIQSAELVKEFANHKRSQRFSEGQDLVSLKRGSADDLREAEATATPHEDEENPVVKSALQALCEEIISQRLLLTDGTAATALFDAQWGIETYREENVSNGAVTHFYAVSKRAQLAIRDAIVESEATATELRGKLANYTLHHAGLAVLHLFLQDVLGRSTVAAQIFENKFEEDFSHTRAVTVTQKVFAFACIIGCNAFFVYYMLLKALEKGQAWQRDFVVACVAQMVVEILLNETVECIWLNYFVPTLVRKEVARAIALLKQVAEELTGDLPRGDVRVTSHIFLDAASYLFSSTKVAQANPALLESVVVLSYHTHLPGELARTWPHYLETLTREEQELQRRGAGSGPYVQYKLYALRLIFAVSAATVLTLQWLGTFEFTYQRVIIRFIQPLLFTGLTLLCFFAASSPAAMVAVILIGAVLLAAIVWQHRIMALQDADNIRVASTAEDVDQALEQELLDYQRDASGKQAVRASTSSSSSGEGRVRRPFVSSKRAGSGSRSGSSGSSSVSMPSAAAAAAAAGRRHRNADSADDHRTPNLHSEEKPADDVGGDYETITSLSTLNGSTHNDVANLATGHTKSRDNACLESQPPAGGCVSIHSATNHSSLPSFFPTSDDEEDEEKSIQGRDSMETGGGAIDTGVEGDAVLGTEVPPLPGATLRYASDSDSDEDGPGSMLSFTISDEW